MQIPIVDETDTPIGIKDRASLAYEDIYRVAALWVTDSEGNILLAQRALSKKNDPGKWGPAVAGTVEEGETYEENILKETHEELGVRLERDALKLGPKMRRTTPTGNYFCQWFLATLDKPLSEFRIPAEEVAGLRWMKASELREDLQAHPETYLSSAAFWTGTLI